MNRIISAIVLLVGLALIGYGYNASESVASETSEVLSGTPTSSAMWLMIAGGVVALIGLFGVFRGPSTRTA